MKIASVSAAVALALVAVGSAQQRPEAQQHPEVQHAPTFKSGTQLVEVDVRVFDKAGRFVTGLTPQDLELKEDGAAQAIVSMALVSPGPETRTTSKTGNELEGPNARPAGESRLTWVFLFDTPHLSLNGLHYTRQAAADFLGSGFRDGDLGGVVFDGVMLNNRLTTDRKELLGAVDGIRQSAQSGNFERFMHDEWPRIQDEHEAWMIADRNDGEAIGIATRRACNDRPSECEGFSDPSQPVKSKARQVLDESRIRTDASLRVIRALCNGLARTPGPKTIVYFSEGFGISGDESALRDVTGLANRAGAHLYTVDARGLNHGSASSGILTAAQPLNPMGAPPQFDWTEDSTNALAVDTGGIAIRNENNFGRALDEIRRDAESYYVVAYSPANQTFDGKYRAIDVKVKGRSGLTIRARRGYLALEPAKLLVPIATGNTPAATPRASTESTAEEVDAEAEAEPANAVVAHTDAPSAPAPDAVRARIENGGLVTAAGGGPESAADDPASRGWAAYQKGDVETAARELKAAAASGQARPWLHYVLGFCALALQQYGEAAASWEQVRHGAPAFEPVYFNLADAYLSAGDTARAGDVLAEAAKRWPKDAEVFDATGVIQIRRGNLVDAIAAFERATRLAPKDPLGFFNLASAHHAAALRLRQLARSSPAQQQRATVEDRRLLVLSGAAGLMGKALWHRNEAIRTYQRVIALKGDYAPQARKALDALGAK